jgi:hypothetical protein
MEGLKVSVEKAKDQSNVDQLFDKQDVVHKESMLECKTANTEFYTQVLGRLLKQILRVRIQFQEKGSWFLLLDTTPASSCPGSEMLSVESWCYGNQQPMLFTCSCTPTYFCSLK